MQYTLLELTQSVLSSMDGEEVDTIDETVESRQVVAVLKTVYDDIVSRGDVPINKTIFTLTPSGDSDKPVLMTKPTTIDSIEWIRYNKIQVDDDDPKWEDINWLPLPDFIIRSQELLPSNDDVDTMTHTANGFEFSFNYWNERGPSFYTSFDDNTLIFDAIDLEVDTTTLLDTKTMCFGRLANVFTESDVWVPNLHPHQFPLLLNEAKSLAWAELKQTPHIKAENTARRNWINLSKTKEHVDDERFGSLGHPFAKLPNFGRKR